MESDKVFAKSGNSEISLVQRPSFLDDLAREFDGHYVRITTVGPWHGDARNCRLSGILGNPTSIVFQMECDNDSETRYAVANPERLIAHRNDAGELTSLEIVSLDGSITNVWFEGPREHQEREAA